MCVCVRERESVCVCFDGVCAAAVFAEMAGQVFRLTSVSARESVCMRVCVCACVDGVCAVL